MIWIAEITNVSGDKELARSTLEKSGYTISPDPADLMIWLVKHPKYEQFSSASEVHQDIKAVISRLTEMGKLEEFEFAASAGAVRQLNPDGTTNKIGFMYGSGSLCLRGKAELTLTYSPNISQAEREKLLREAALREAAKKRTALISRVAASLNDPTVILITRLVKSPNLSMTEAGHIVDLVQEAMHGDMSSLTNKNELKRFTGSINNPKVMGLAARHAVTNHQPPPNPMTENEARSYAKRIGQDWLRLKERDTK